jgi:DNA-binding transcriptional MerR regulator
VAFPQEMNNLPPSPLLTRQALAKVLRLHPDTLRRWVRRGLIPEISLSPRIKRYSSELAKELALREAHRSTRKPGPKPQT